jgi:hypothetical protein
MLDGRGVGSIFAGSMHPRARCCLGLVLTFTAACAPAIHAPTTATPPGAGLKPGLILVYAANGTRGSPWMYEQVQRLRIGDLSCVRIRVRKSPSEATERRVRCTDGKLLLEKEPASERMTALRPVAPGQTLELRQEDGGLVRFQTGALRTIRVAGRHVSVVETTATTEDAAGKPVRRLREHFALSLDTATSGVFEVADEAGWQEKLRFQLVEIRE